jgi:hypothetical protein
MPTDTPAFEYAMGLFSVLIGLAVIDVATSAHRLLRHRREVLWDPLTIASAIYALCTAVYMWFDIWGVRHFSATRHFPFYLGLVAQFFVLFLAAAASLPDEAEKSLDLRLYYHKNRTYFWSLLALFQLGYTAFGLYFEAHDIRRAPVSLAILLVSIMSAPTVISGGLIVLKSRTLHYIGIGLLFGIMVFHYAAAQIN